MALGLYKPGQGYWTRVLTAVGLGVLALAGASWLWNQLAGLPVPKRAWTLDVTPIAGAPSPQKEAILFADAQANTRLGSGIIESVENAGKRITIANLRLEPGATVANAQRIEAANASGGPEAFSASIARREGIASFNIIYAQAGAAMAVIIAATAFIYWLTAIRPSSNEFFIAVDTEMRKVNWSTRREVLGSTWVVIIVCGSIAAVLFVIDIAFGAFFKWIGVIGA